MKVKGKAFKAGNGQTYFSGPPAWSGRVRTQPATFHFLSGPSVYPQTMLKPPKPTPGLEEAIQKTVRLIDRLVEEKYGRKGKFLGVDKSVEVEEYAIFYALPEGAALDFDDIVGIGVEVMELGERFGYNLLYFPFPSQKDSADVPSASS
jgi:hypothetical protein